MTIDQRVGLCLGEARRPTLRRRRWRADRTAWKGPHRRQTPAAMQVQDNGGLARLCGAPGDKLASVTSASFARSAASLL